MLPNAKYQVRPISHCMVPLSQTLDDHCVSLEHLLHLTRPHSLILYKTLRSKEIFDISLDIYYSRFSVIWPLPHFQDIADEPVSDDADLFLFFDSAEFISESQFVDCCSNVVKLEWVCTDIDFFDFNLRVSYHLSIGFAWMMILLPMTPIMYIAKLLTLISILPCAFCLLLWRIMPLSQGMLISLQLSKDNPSLSIVFDSGTSLAISGHRDDFIGPIWGFPEVWHLRGMAGSMLIDGIGDVQWTFCRKTGYTAVHTECYHVPDCKSTLLSPQQLLNDEKGYGGYFHVLENHSVLGFHNGHEPLVVECVYHSNLPIALAKNDMMVIVHANLCILNDDNQNLTPGQKLLLLWHAKFAHKNFQAVPSCANAHANLPFVSSQKFLAASRCDRPRCEVCKYGIAHRKFTKGNKQQTNPST